MNRKLKLIIVFILIFMLIFYFGIEGKEFEIIDNDALKFISIYLDSFQKYLFVITITVGLVITFVQVPFNICEIRSRIKNNIFQYVWSKYLSVMIILSIYILLTFFVISLTFGYDNVFNIFNFAIFFRLFTYILSCFTFYTVIYFFSSNHVLSLSTMITSNFLLLITVNVVNFYLTNNAMSENTTMFILGLYSWSINVVGLSYLFFNMDKKECLK